jgi:hypothetical protein
MNQTEINLAALALVRAAVAKDTDTLQATITRAGETKQMTPLFLALLEVSANALDTNARLEGLELDELIDALQLHYMTKEVNPSE